MPGGDVARWLALEPLGHRAPLPEGAPDELRVGQRRVLPLPGGGAVGDAGAGVPLGHLWDLRHRDWIPGSRNLGQTRLPGQPDRQATSGSSSSPISARPTMPQLLVTPDYNPFERRRGNRGRRRLRPLRAAALSASAQRDDGRFDSLFIITNRARFARDGDFYPGQRLQPGPAPLRPVLREYAGRLVLRTGGWTARVTATMGPDQRDRPLDRVPSSSTQCQTARFKRLAPKGSGWA